MKSTLKTRAPPTIAHATQMPSNSTFPFMWHLRATRCRSCDCVSAGAFFWLIMKRFASRQTVRSNWSFRHTLEELYFSPFFLSPSSLSSVRWRVRCMFLKCQAASNLNVLLGREKGKKKHRYPYNVIYYHEAVHKLQLWLTTLIIFLAVPTFTQTDPIPCFISITERRVFTCVFYTHLLFLTHVNADRYNELVVNHF